MSKTSTRRSLEFTSRPVRAALLLASCVLAAAASSCSGGRGRVIQIRMDSLEGAKRVPPAALYRAAIADSAPIARRGAPLGRRLSLIQVSSGAEWASLRRAAPALGDPPDFSRGTVVALLCCAGQPLSNDWPIEIQDVRLHEGAGLLTAHFESGTYLPDGTTVLEAAFVPGLASVLVADVDGTRFFLD